MKRTMTRIMNFFEPAYHAFCKSIWGHDITHELAQKWDMDYAQVHEHVMAWSLLANFLLVIAIVVLVLVFTVKI
jgi:hypothetical protein